MNPFKKKTHPFWPVCVAWALVLVSPAQADNDGGFYAVKTLSELTYVDGGLETIDTAANSYAVHQRFGPSEFTFHRVALDGPGQAYLDFLFVPWDLQQQLATATLAVRAPQRQEITGRLFLPRFDADGMHVLQFKIPADDLHDDQADSQHRIKFLETQAAHYQAQLEADLPGAAWFRHQLRSTLKTAADELGEDIDEDDPPQQPQRPRTGGELERSYDLFTGGRAIEENLQLDRLLPTDDSDDQPTVKLDSIAGITVPEFDWTPLIEAINQSGVPTDAPEETTAGDSPDADVQGETSQTTPGGGDPLAKLIPDDQHAVFFPSFQAMLDVADHTNQHGTPVLEAVEPRAEDRRVRQWYERQLCLPASTLARLLGPKLIGSVAITGSDPYLRTGSDLAILFEAKNPQALATLITARVSLAGGVYPGAEKIEGEFDGVAYTGMRSPDRAVSSYVATLGDVIVVTNSPAQLQRLVKVSKGDVSPLAALPEYVFFRHRYSRDAPQESAFLMLSDKTIRRWCGPRWRIASSRRTRAAAVMAEIQAQHADRLTAGEVDEGPIQDDSPWADAGDLTISKAGVQSQAYGSLRFMTPILELDFNQVTEQESQLYSRWRDGYQRYWNNFFDPIGARLSAADDATLSVDLTVMPLIERSDYREAIELSHGAQIAPNSGDPHDGTLAHLAFAINRDSPMFNQFTSWTVPMMGLPQADPLGWMGQTVALYLDAADPLWEQLAAAPDPQQFLHDESNFKTLPAALYIEVKDAVKLAVFLTALRGHIEQTGPELTKWETRSHNHRSYVAVEATRPYLEEDDNSITIYYAASADGLTVTLNEPLLQRALDRQAARRQAIEENQPLPRHGAPWLGDNFCLQLSGPAIRMLDQLSWQSIHAQMQLLAWKNIPILNEWKQRYPDHDPVELHEKLWHVQLVCPGGGSYQWNEQWQTMESTVFGHPGQPKQGPSLPEALADVALGNFGLTFEENGLRAAVSLTRQPPSTDETSQ